MNNFLQLLELAGTLDDHVKAEKAVFNPVCVELKKLAAFADKQQEKKIYSPIKTCALELCAKLENHLDRYK